MKKKEIRVNSYKLQLTKNQKSTLILLGGFNSKLASIKNNVGCSYGRKRENENRIFLKQFFHHKLIAKNTFFKHTQTTTISNTHPYQRHQTTKNNNQKLSMHDHKHQLASTYTKPLNC